MFARQPRIPHRLMRWLIISLMVINGIQLVLLQLTVNSTANLDVSQAWTYVIASLVCLLVSAALIGYAFLKADRGPGSRIKVKEPGAGGTGTVSSGEKR